MGEVNVFKASKAQASPSLTEMSAMVLLTLCYLYKHIRNRVWSMGLCWFTCTILGHVRTRSGHQLYEASKRREKASLYSNAPLCQRVATSVQRRDLSGTLPLLDDCKGSVQFDVFA
jgi:hypothetical protein